jgi:hypothetical protein
VRGALGNWRPYRDSKSRSKRCLGPTAAKPKDYERAVAVDAEVTGTNKTTPGE